MHTTTAHCLTSEPRGSVTHKQRQWKTKYGSREWFLNRRRATCASHVISSLNLYYAVMKWLVCFWNTFLWDLTFVHFCAAWLSRVTETVCSLWSGISVPRVTCCLIWWQAKRNTDPWDAHGKAFPCYYTLVTLTQEANMSKWVQWMSSFTAWYIFFHIIEV